VTDGSGAAASGGGRGRIIDLRGGGKDGGNDEGVVVVLASPVGGGDDGAVIDIDGRDVESDDDEDGKVDVVFDCAVDVAVADADAAFSAALSAFRCFSALFFFFTAASMSRFTRSSRATSECLRAFEYADKRRFSRAPPSPPPFASKSDIGIMREALERSTIASRDGGRFALLDALLEKEKMLLRVVDISTSLSTTFPLFSVSSAPTRNSALAFETDGRAAVVVVAVVVVSAFDELADESNALASLLLLLPRSLPIPRFPLLSMCSIDMSIFDPFAVLDPLCAVADALADTRCAAPAPPAA
jgi:hypothetical protein